MTCTLHIGYCVNMFVSVDKEALLERASYINNRERERKLCQSEGKRLYLCCRR